MTTTYPQPPAPQAGRVPDDVKLILDQAQEAIREIDYWAYEVSDRIAELCGLDDLPKDVEDLANDLSHEVEDLSGTLDWRLEQLRRVIAARTADNAASGEADEDDNTD